MSKASEPSNSPPIAPLNIISLDDDRDFCEYLEGILTQDAHSVRTVNTPAALFKEIDRDRPDIVLLDMNMGIHSGQEVLSEIRERWPTLCIIIVTGFPSMDSMRETFKQDVFDYLAKPFGIEELRQILAQAAHTFGLGLKPMDKLRSVLGRQMRLARTERGWTLRELSEASSLSVSQLSSIERGTHLPSIESLVSISKALGARPSQWFATAGF